MFTWLAKRSESRRKARELYGAVVTQARDPAFYRRLGVADTPEGRYEVIALHLVLLLDRLGGSGVGGTVLRRETLEAFVTDMDDAMREMGVSDVRVPRNVKKAAGGVYTRSNAYGAALNAPVGDNAALQDALTTYVYQGRPEAPLNELASYVRGAVAHLADEPDAALWAGKVTFPRVGASDDTP